MWKRWHQTTHIWERSTDNGLTWSPLPINAASINEGTIPVGVMPTNVAYKNIDNQFVTQTLATGTTISGAASQLHFYDTSSPVNGRRWRFINYAANDFRLESLNDAGSAINITPLYVNTAGDAYVGRNVVAVNAFYELGRSVAQGYWNAVPFNAANFTADQGMTITIGTSQVSPNQYTLIGKTLHWCIGMNNFALGGTNGNVQLTLPAGLVAGVTGTVGTFIITNNLSGVGWKIAMCSTTAGSNKLGLVHLPNFLWTAGDNNNWAYVNVTLQIQ